VTGAAPSQPASFGPVFSVSRDGCGTAEDAKNTSVEHFVPAYDTWFDGTFCKQWGQKHDTNVIVDHINLVDLSAKAASRGSAKKGNDISCCSRRPRPTRSKPLTCPMCTRKWRRSTARKSISRTNLTYNPKTKRYFAFSDSYVLIRQLAQGLVDDAGFPNGPDTWKICASAPRRFATSPAIPAALVSLKNSIPAWQCAHCSGPLRCRTG